MIPPLFANGDLTDHGCVVAALLAVALVLAALVL